jgi:thioredoxin reductase (NADPH)
VYDLVVIGAGPAGLAAAVYGASEGAPHRGAGTYCARGPGGPQHAYRNYLGFPTGITGGELAERAYVQANKFGTRLSVATPVTGGYVCARISQGHVNKRERPHGKRSRHLLHERTGSI